MKTTTTRKYLCLALSALIIFLSACTSNTVQMPDVSYTDQAYQQLNNNYPLFDEDEITTKSYEKYSRLDSLNRCGVAQACIGIDIMPRKERESIGQVKPSGWKIAKYDIVDGKYLYNRCHLIGYQLTGENANEKNLITGTRYMNVEGMLPFENEVSEYVKRTNNHVMYRVTPVFEGRNLVASGVIMEALSVEDGGKGVCFNVFVFNVQPGIKINYTNGESWLDDNYNINIGKSELSTDTKTYILNTKTMKIHLDTCSSVQDISEKNKKKYSGGIDELIKKGYSRCKVCNP